MALELELEPELRCATGAALSLARAAPSAADAAPSPARTHPRRARRPPDRASPRKGQCRGPADGVDSRLFGGCCQLARRVPFECGPRAASVMRSAPSCDWLSAAGRVRRRPSSSYRRATVVGLSRGLTFEIGSSSLLVTCQSRVGRKATGSARGSRVGGARSRARPAVKRPSLQDARAGCSATRLDSTRGDTRAEPSKFKWAHNGRRTQLEWAFECERKWGRARALARWPRTRSPFNGLQCAIDKFNGSS